MIFCNDRMFEHGLIVRVSKSPKGGFFFLCECNTMLFQNTIR